VQTPSTESTRTIPTAEMLTPRDVVQKYQILEGTQAVWRSTNRYGFRDLVIKLGSSVRYKRDDFDRWIESRRASEMEA